MQIKTFNFGAEVNWDIFSICLPNQNHMLPVSILAQIIWKNNFRLTRNVQVSRILSQLGSRQNQSFNRFYIKKPLYLSKCSSGLPRVSCIHLECERAPRPRWVKSPISHILCWTLDQESLAIWAMWSLCVPQLCS